MTWPARSSRATTSLRQSGDEYSPEPTKRPAPKMLRPTGSPDRKGVLALAVVTDLHAVGGGYSAATSAVHMHHLRRREAVEVGGTGVGIGTDVFTVEVFTER